MPKAKPPIADFSEQTLESHTAYAGEMLTLKVDRVRLHDGTLAKREYVTHPGAVLIIPLIDEKTLLLEYQFRHPVGRHGYELPAGKIEPNEEPLQTAKRELIEETGYEATNWTHLVTHYPCVGYSNERIELYLAQELRYVGHQPDEGEFLETFAISIAEALDWVKAGKITDTKAIMGLLLAEKIGRGEWESSGEHAAPK